MSTEQTTRSRRRLGRPGKDGDEGPRAKFSQLLPYLFEHRGVLAVVVVLSILGAAASLAQPLLVSQVIDIVGKGDPLGPLVWLLVALVVVSALISGYQHYLLQRTGEEWCSPPGAGSWAGCCASRSASSTPGERATSSRGSARTRRCCAPC
ncbi:hypothetical protein [Leifsonia poae]|uniref:hypothetical protein n=1 Tax=Leifsonia poae TaxID=110933 RepID=UPI003D677AB8